jgi:hypothetical protein
LRVEDCRQRAAAAADRRGPSLIFLPVAWSAWPPAARYYATLEARNQAAARALLLYYQLAALYARQPLWRHNQAWLQALLDKAEQARQQKVPYPVEPQDLRMQLEQVQQALEQTEAALRLLHVELKQLLDWPATPEEERFWPVGDFTVEVVDVLPEQAGAWAVQDRAELRAVRSLYQELAETASRGPLARWQRWMRPVWFRQQWAQQLRQLQDQQQALERWLRQRTGAVEDEARAAAILLAEQTRQLAAARQRLQQWDQRWREAQRKSEARQPNAEVYEAQVRWQRSLAEAALIEATAAWHQARVRLRAAIGWFAYDDLPTSRAH